MHFATKCMQKWYKNLPYGTRNMLSKTLNISDNNLLALLKQNSPITLRNMIIISAVTDSKFPIKEIFPEIALFLELLVQTELKEKLLEIENQRSNYVTIRKPSSSVRTINQYLYNGFFNHIKTKAGFDDYTNELMHLQREINNAADSKDRAKLKAHFLQRAVVLGQKIIIAGETGLIKTSFMKTLMQSISKTQRLITIENVP